MSGRVCALVAAAVLAGCAGSGAVPGAVPSSTDEPTSVGAGTDVGASLAAPDTPTAAAPPSPPTPSPSRSGTPTATSPAPDATAGPPRSATLSDVAGFLGTVEPRGVSRVDGVAADLDGDGGPDVLLGGLKDGRGWVGTATWDGTDFRLAAEGSGGPGDRVDDLRLADVNADGIPEVVLAVSGEGIGSVALWALPSPDRLVPLDAHGGCNAGSHVYGAIGAELVRGADDTLDVVATCDDAPLPVADWTSHRYGWDGTAYVAS